MRKYIDNKTFAFIIQFLSDKAPRIKWVSAKVIGNCILLFSTHIVFALKHLLKIYEHIGTVVRWGAVNAILQILLKK